MVKRSHNSSKSGNTMWVNGHIAAVRFVRAGIVAQSSEKEKKVRRGRPTSFHFREYCSALHMFWSDICAISD